MDSHGPNNGVMKKIFAQVRELKRLGQDIELILIRIGKISYPSYDFLTICDMDEVPSGDYFGRFRRACKISNIYGELIDSLGPGDILYMRFTSAFPPISPKYYYKLRRRACKIVTEHQTKELDEFKLNGRSLTYWSELFFGTLLRKQSDAIVGVTGEIAQYEIAKARDLKKPNLVIGNGFTVQSVPMRQAPCNNKNVLDILCVANVSRWHGLDRLLRGIAAYDGTSNVILHIAGDGPELDNLKKLANELDIADRVVFHGFMMGKALDALFDKCHIAVGSLGIHRKGLMQTSELKAREYCARGIPYVIACADPDFPDDFPYIFRLSASESPIDIDQVLTFAQAVCIDPDHPQQMRRYAEEHLDWSVKMKKLKEFLGARVRN